MANTFFNEYDLVILVIMIISTLIAVIRGFIREVFSLIGWIGAALITFLFFEKTANYLSNYFENKTVVSAISVLGLFTISLIAISIVNMVLTDFSRAIRLGAIDRSLGLAFGFVRGMIIVSVIHYCITLIYNKPEDEPKWFKDSTTYNFTNFGASMLKDLTFDYLHGAKKENPVNKGIADALGNSFANYSGDRSAFSALRNKDIFRKIIKGLPQRDKEKVVDKLNELPEYPTAEQKNRILLEMLVTYKKAYRADIVKDENKIDDSDYLKLEDTIIRIQKSLIKKEVDGQPWLNGEEQNSGGETHENSVEGGSNNEVPVIDLPNNLLGKPSQGTDE